MRIEQLMDSLPKSYTPADRELILRAYRVAESAHEGQTRASGEPYISHCLAVAGILAELHVPPSVVAAGLLHDTVEDTAITLNDLQRDFGAEITNLVDGVTKLTQLPRVSRGDQRPEDEAREEEERQIAERRGIPGPDEAAQQIVRSRRYDLVSETLRKTFLAMGEDVRVVLIKLADRLHNMRTLSHMPGNKRKRIAQQTMDIFAPLANRLGIWQIKWELEDLSFRYIDPETYREIAEHLAKRRANREREMQKITHALNSLLERSGIRAEVIGRPKHIYSIYRKMHRKGVPFEMVFDVRGVRVVVPDIQTCYAALGVIHTHWRPIPNEFDDYIASPKDNFYQSLHTAVVFDDGGTLEVQIRTPEMDQNAEYGIAAHWRYKEGADRDDDYERRILWLRSLMEWRQDVEDAREFVDGLKSDVFEDRVYVFTPRGDIIDLPAGSTPIDFAYHIHTDVGHRCRGAKVNGKLVSLDYVLKTGEKVEILTAKRGGPSRDWLNPNLGLVKTQRARGKIRRWFKRQAREHNITQGKTLMDKELRRLGLTSVNLDRLAREFDFRSVDDFYEAIGNGDVPIGRIVNHLTLEEEEKKDSDLVSRPAVGPISPDGDSVSILGLKGLLTVMAKCCNPAPGDAIIGYITRGRGATIHRQDCPNIMRIRDRERLVKVSWGEPKNTYPVPVRIRAYDRDGLMKDVSTIIADEGINMAKVNVDVNKKNLAVFELILEVRDLAQLSKVLDRLENLPNVLQAQRSRPG
ncbi:MAG TPA: bifunctional (p)ppGpp synthetase/guanosine-3',5'-bis(diphosphate) 3'-pyrophosphohydrolase [Anaerolineales bacterium]|nr:bifunctional (p)ppGpp synthetase/guanosine-3',5'-bis(diphosphate) 3'-pyrophosphohydrolase [Anaerolineales bacterium]